MATVTRRCKGERCRRRFRISAQSRRQWCEQCRPSRSRAASDPAPVLPGPGSGAGRIESATLAELAAAGREQTSAGVEALHLASLLDAGGHTAQGAAALAKARRDAMTVALAGAKPADDALDELRRRREAKAAGA